MFSGLNKSWLRGFTLFMSPCAAKSETLFGTGYLPFSDQSYNLTGEDLALSAPREQTLVGYHAEEILEGASAALLYGLRLASALRPAAMARESRGIFRVHQFHKVEQIIFCKPEDSPGA